MIRKRFRTRNAQMRHDEYGRLFKSFRVIELGGIGQSEPHSESYIQKIGNIVGFMLLTVVAFTCIEKDGYGASVFFSKEKVEELI